MPPFHQVMEEWMSGWHLFLHKGSFLKNTGKRIKKVKQMFSPICQQSISKQILDNRERKSIYHARGRLWGRSDTAWLVAALHPIIWGTTVQQQPAWCWFSLPSADWNFPLQTMQHHEVGKIPRLLLGLSDYHSKRKLLSKTSPHGLEILCRTCFISTSHVSPAASSSFGQTRENPEGSVVFIYKKLGEALASLPPPPHLTCLGTV